MIFFSNTFAVLKPGGVFGVVEHRAKPGTSMEVMKKVDMLLRNMP